MKQVKIQELNLENFAKYGAFSNMLNPNWSKLGQEPCEFYRDMNILDLGGGSSVAFSVTRVCERLKVVDVLEFHTSTGEGILPLDGDIVMQLAVATQKPVPPIDMVEAYRVPKGTMVMLRPGVWHGGPFTAGTKCVNILIALPERAYANDCTIVELLPENVIELI